MPLEPELMPLTKAIRLPRNPKLHDLGALHQSFDRFGFLQRIVVNATTGRLIAGHGRIDALQQRKAKGLPRPANVEENGDGAWLVPVDRVSIPEDQEEAAALALNRIGEGDWDDPLLAAVLGDLAALEESDGGSGLLGTGFDRDELDGILAGLMEHEPFRFPDDDGSGPAKMELLPDEKYDYVLLAFKNQAAFDEAVTALGLERRRDPRSGWAQHIGLCRVIDGVSVIQRLSDAGRDTE